MRIRAVSISAGASLLKYIGEQFGIEAIKLLWERDVAAFAQRTGNSLAVTEERWRAWLAAAVSVSGAREMRGGLHEFTEEPASAFIGLDQHFGNATARRPQRHC